MECDHGASLLLETSSNGDIPLEGPSPLELALETENIDFISHSRVMRVLRTAWWDYNYMDPVNCDYPNEAPPLANSLINPRKFFVTAAGKFWVSTILFTIYCFLFTWVTAEKTCVYQAPSEVEITFWVCSIGYVVQELQQMLDQGIGEYFGNPANMLDSGVVGLFICLAGVRFNATEYTIEENCDEFERTD
eukprot:UN31749